MTLTYYIPELPRSSTVCAKFSFGLPLPFLSSATIIGCITAQLTACVINQFQNHHTVDRKKGSEGKVVESRRKTARTPLKTVEVQEHVLADCVSVYELTREVKLSAASRYPTLNHLNCFHIE